ncbi:MAG: MBL fold metallo-hydrolase [Candidatus Omnitrophota bacterium]
MEIKVIFDEDSCAKNLHIGWGVSFLVDNRILFDTGENGQWLIENIDKLGINLAEFEAVVISHDHWDHAGGLWEILARRKGITVYACPHFSAEFKEKVKKLQGIFVETEKFKEIAKDIFITGEIPGVYHGSDMPEQALIVKTQNGLTVMTGCAHPGILKILERVRRKFPGETIYLVFGGFHLMEEDKRIISIIAKRFQKMKIEKVGPTHCSGKVAEEIFKERYGDRFIPIKAGQTLNL